MSKPKKHSQSEFEQVLSLIHEARNKAFAKVNAELVLLYYNVGKIVSQKVKDGVWGESTVDELAKFILSKMPNLSGFNRRGLYRMKQFFETYSVEQFVSPMATLLETSFNLKNANTKVSALPAQLPVKKSKSQKVSPVRTQIPNLDLMHQQFVTSLMTQISWTHHLQILSKTRSPEEQLFYIITIINEKLSVRELVRQLKSGFYERTMMGNKIVSSVMTQLPEGIFKDPYIFEFLDLPEIHSENDLEKALVTNLQKFILEIGKGFTYMGNQFRLQVGNKDYYTDLLFYHRDLQCLVLFELKIEDFAPEFLGKLNFYLEALDRDVKRPNENASIGILLCKGKDVEVVEYAIARNTSPAIIADYETKLIDRKLLAAKLHQLVEIFDKRKRE